MFLQGCDDTIGIVSDPNPNTGTDACQASQALALTWVRIRAKLFGTTESSSATTSLDIKLDNRIDHDDHVDCRSSAVIVITL